jgi:hypothetical protein
VIRFIVLLPLLCSPAFAHGPAEWIQRGQYKNEIGELCCGEKDCVELDHNDVTPVDGGYLIKSLNEFVPQSETLPFSPGGFWRCAWGGARKCFFITPSGS